MKWHCHHSLLYSPFKHVCCFNMTLILQKYIDGSVYEILVLIVDGNTIICTYIRSYLVCI